MLARQGMATRLHIKMAESEATVKLSRSPTAGPVWTNVVGSSACKAFLASAVRS